MLQQEYGLSSVVNSFDLVLCWMGQPATNLVSSAVPLIDISATVTTLDIELSPYSLTLEGAECGDIVYEVDSIVSTSDPSFDPVQSLLASTSGSTLTLADITTYPSGQLTATINIR